MSKLKRVALYCRVSTDGQTTENQQRELRAAIDRNGGTIAVEYVDHGISGAKGRKDRPQFDAPLRAVARKEFDVVAAWSVDRLGRGKFVTALKAARAAGKLHGAWSLAAGPWRALLARLHAHEWVVYAKQPLGGPAQVLEYLGRYTHRVAISNERIVAVDDGEVRFRVRDSAAGNRKRLLRLPAATFIDRFLLHVLPHGFKRIRHYGLLGPATKAVKLAQARAALAVPVPDPVVVESVAAFMCRVERIGWARCPHCGKGDFVPTAAIPMPTRPALHARGPP